MTSDSFEHGTPSQGVTASKAGVEPDDDMLGSLPKFISPLSFGCDLFKVFAACLNPLGNFCRQALHLHMSMDNSCSSKHLWPCPIPASVAPPRDRLSGRRQSRYKLRVCVREHLRLFVASSNWLCMGRPRKLTQTWPPCSAAQRRMLTDLEHSLNLFYRLGRGPSSGLDRALGKFGSLSESLQQLTAASQSLRHQLDSYCRSRSFATHNFDATASEGLDGPTLSSSSFPQPGTAPVLQKSGSSALDLKPERIQFKQSPSFKPDKFISDPLLKAGFMDPKHLRLPKHLWPSPKLARVMCSRESLLELFQKWDDHNCLQLVEASESESKYRCGLFAVYKSEDRDRQILNPIPENSRCMTQNESTMTLAHGSLLCGLHLADSEDLLIGADDLEDFYHCFKVSRDHSLRNHIHGVFPGDTFKGWNAWSPDLSGKMVVGCFGTLAMGNSFAVELAQHTHTNLLSRAGVLKEAEQVCYRKPLPRSSTLQLLCIDDLAVLQKVPRGISASSSKCFRGDRELLEKAGNAYADAGLRTSAKKAVRDADTATILGGELDGRRGILSAPRLRIVTLSRLTLQLVKIGWATKNLMEVIIGSWIFVLLFRRPLLALFNDVFHEGEGCKSRHEIFKLSSGALQELMLVALWSPFAFTNLRAQPLDQIFCSDASLHGGGVCSAQFSREGTLELGRIAEQKGFYTRVDSSTLGRYLAAHGEDHVDPPGIPPSLQEGFLWDFCEIFRGVGTLSQAHAAAGLTVHPGFEIRDGPCGDVLHPATALAIIGLICRRVIRCFHVAPVCTTFGTLRRPRLRSKLMPYGFNPDEKHTHEGNQFAIRGGFILFLCHYYELLVSAEQPNGSVMFRLDLYQRLLTLGFLSVRFPFCSWGTPFQKLSWWLHNNPLLSELADHCRCGAAGNHFRVQGTFDALRLAQFKRCCRPNVIEVFGREPRLNEHVAHFSGGYPIPLCNAIASLNIRQFKIIATTVEPDVTRPHSSPPRWMTQLGCGLTWKKLIQYRFKKANHINVNEHLSYRSLVKHVSKTSPHSRFCALLDSRVIIGCNAKGRSSSKQLNFYLGSSLPYIIGGDLYPALLHIGSKDNASDDVSRFVKLRKATESLAPWLQQLLAGKHSIFEEIWKADQLKWPLNGWARLIRLSLLAYSNH